MKRLSPALLALAVGCATDTQLLAPDGRQLVDVPPASYRIAVLPVTTAGDVVKESDGLYFRFTADALQERLVAEMSTLHAASAVFACKDMAATKDANADLVLVPRMVVARLEYVSMADTWWASGLLWITTWIGGLFVADSTYEARVELEIDVRNACDPDEVIGFTATSSTTNLTFWDRNGFLSGGFFLSLILPPFWTSDNRATTGQSLSQTAMQHLAGQITSFLKFELGEREKDTYGQIRFDSPENGAPLGESTVVAGTVHGRHPVVEITVTANGVSVPLVTRIRGPIDQMQGSRFREPFRSEQVPLRPGPNPITVKVTLLPDSGRALVSSRTLIVQGPTGSPAALPSGAGSPGAGR